MSTAANASDNAGTIATAISDGKSSLDLRYRFEHVSQDSVAEDANGSTLRLRLNYQTAAYQNLDAFVEFDYVAELLFDDFNSGAGTSPNRSQYPVIADPDGADLNQLYVDFNGIENLAIRAGRQRILLDNQRFVGGVGWRQNEQTYDGITFHYGGISGAELHYSYVSRVHRIFGDRAAAGRHDNDTHLLNLQVGVANHWVLSPYAYWIDNDDAAAFSTATVGLRATGEWGKRRRLTLTVDGATQTDTASAPVSYRAGYLRVDASLALNKALTLGLGFESLGGDSDAAGKAFRTPLATLHAFQGWADQFLTTPDAGVEDTFVSLGYSRDIWKIAAVYHRFRAEDGGTDWGQELDVSASRKLGERYGLQLKLAIFDADDAAYTDVSKAWVMLTAGF